MVYLVEDEIVYDFLFQGIFLGLFICYGEKNLQKTTFSLRSLRRKNINKFVDILYGDPIVDVTE